ncbi:hypothetical protein V8F20_000166 [Naviculisporaceae sp. PSN 640]
MDTFDWVLLSLFFLWIFPRPSLPIYLLPPLDLTLLFYCIYLATYRLLHIIYFSISKIDGYKLLELKEQVSMVELRHRGN